MTPSSICSGMPPTAPAMVGRAFHMASVTVSPKPSRGDFCRTTVALALEGIDLNVAYVARFESMKMSGSPFA